MTEHPIIFTGESVRAIIDLRKTMTRRVIRIPTVERKREFTGKAWVDPGLGDGPYLKAEYASIKGGPGDTVVNRIYGPYAVGDRLWVKETWMPETEQGCSTGAVIYRATDKPYPDGETILKWRSPIFMPRWASRLTLEVTATRAERLWAMSQEDVRAEGYDSHICCDSPETWYPKLWDSINAKRGHGWEKNDWVWVYSFRRVTP
jgi:hypothetical protein